MSLTLDALSVLLKDSSATYLAVSRDMLEQIHAELSDVAELEERISELECDLENAQSELDYHVCEADCDRDHLDDHVCELKCDRLHAEDVRIVLSTPDGRIASRTVVYSNTEEIRCVWIGKGITDFGGFVPWWAPVYHPEVIADPDRFNREANS